MSDLMMSNESSNREFDVHPEGTFVAVCRDIYVERKPNPKYPGINMYGKPEPEISVRVVMEFLTDEAIEINGELLPRFLRTKFNQSWNEKSGLRKFVTLWNPKVGKADKADLDTLVGLGGYLTVTHTKSTDGKVYANITGIAPPPKGATIPLIPLDFTRNNGKAVNAQAAPAKVAPVAPAQDEPNDLPF